MQFTLFDAAHNYRSAKDFTKSLSAHFHPKANAGFPMGDGFIFLVWWLSNLGTSESHEGLLKHRSLGTTLRVSNSVDREAYIPNMFHRCSCYIREPHFENHIPPQSEATIERKHPSQLTLYIFVISVDYPIWHIISNLLPVIKIRICFLA